MKKITALAAIILCAFALVFGAAKTVRADGQENENIVNTEIFLPTTYLQYYKLENPYAICRQPYHNRELVAISHKGAIVVYYDEKFYKRDITELSSEQGVPSLQLYGEYLLFSAQSRLYSIFVGDLESGEELSYKSVKCGDETVSANDFSVCGNKVAVITNNSLDFYEIVSDASGIALVKEKGLNKNALNSVLLSKNGLTYYAKDDDNIYVYDNETEEKLVSATVVRSIAESGDIDDKTLYYSCLSGVYSVDLSADKKESVPIKEVSPGNDPDKDLGKLWDPQGICLTGKGIWVVDGEICAVQEIDLSKKEFTDFAITTNSRAVNRLSMNAKGITVDDGNIYALDENRIVVVENAYENKDARTYRRINLDVFPDKFAVGGGFVAYSTGKKVYLGKIPDSEEKQAEITLEQIPLIKGETDSDVVVDMCYKDGAFYVLSNVLDNQKTYPIIYKIDLSAENKTLGNFYNKKVKEEKGKFLAVDVFGSVYMSVTDPSGAKYSFYTVTPEKTAGLIADYVPDGEIIKMQTDFDGKLYLLTAGGTVSCLDVAESGGYEEKFVKNVKKSPNLENSGVGNPVSFTMDENSDKAYFIFGGLILSSSEKTDLNIATVNTIAVPNGFTYAFDLGGSFGKLRENSKLFSVDPVKTDGEYFKYLDYFTQTQPDDYAFIKISDRFSLAIKRGVSAIVRNSDIIGTFAATETSGDYYSLVAFKTYSLPVLEDSYYAELSVDSKQKISVAGEVEFNGVKFVAVCKDNVYGYIPYSFLTERITGPQTEKSVKTAYVYARGGVEVYDENYKLNGKVVVDKERVAVINDGKDYTYVRFGDGTYGYVKTTYLTVNSRENFVKCLVAVLCASSFLVTSLFLERKYLFEAR